MSLQTMIVKLGEAIGLQPTNADNKAQLVRHINTAGREIWASRDLPGSTFEQFFQLPDSIIGSNATNPDVMMTLPWYCEGIRGARWAQVGQKITLQDLRTRYQATPWRQPFLTWRLIRSLALARPLTADGALTFTLSSPQATSLTITVTGTSTTSSSAYEQVSILAGSTTVTTTTQWVELAKISKNIPCTCDVDITDVNGVDMGIIPARQEQSANVLVQIADDYAPMNYLANGVVEIIYKIPFQDLAYDGDAFINTSYEDALIWRARANWAALQSNEVIVNTAMAFSQKSDELISSLSANQEASVEMQMSFAPNRYNNLLNYARYGRRTFMMRYARR